MTIIRHYIMQAAEGQDEALDMALRALTEMVSNISDCEGVECLRDIENKSRFIFMEKWHSVEAHKNAANQLPKDAFAPVMRALSAKPDGSYLDYRYIK